jgi:hypothetical protein
MRPSVRKALGLVSALCVLSGMAAAQFSVISRGPLSGACNPRSLGLDVINNVIYSCGDPVGSTPQQWKAGGGSGSGVTITTVSGLSSISGKTNGTVASVTDGQSVTDCTVGGGSTTVFCQYNGSAWFAISSLASMIYPPAGVPVSPGAGGPWASPSLAEYGTEPGVPTSADPGTNFANVVCTDGSHGIIPCNGSMNSGGTGPTMIAGNQLTAAPTTTIGGLQFGVGVYNNSFYCILLSGVSCLSNTLTGSMGPAAGPSAQTLGFLNNATGTLVNQLAMLVPGSNDTVESTSAASSPTQIAGICVSGCGSSGTAQIAVAGTAACTFSGAATVGDYVQATAGGTSGDCTDAGSSYPTSGSMVVGTVADGGAAGLHNVFIWLAPVAGTVLLQTNSSSNATQSTLNFKTTTVNAVGLTVTPTYGAGGVEQMEVTGSAYTGNAASASNSTAVGGVTISGTPAVGNVPTATSGTAATWQAPSGGSGGGGGSYSSVGTAIAFTTTTAYQALQGSYSTVVTTAANVAQTVGAKATAISQLYVSLGTAVAGSQTFQVTLYDVTLSATEAVTCTVTATNKTCSDTSHSYSVPAGDLVAWQIVSSASLTTNISIGAQGGAASSFSGNTSVAVSASSALAGAAPFAPVVMDGSGNEILSTCSVFGVCGLWNNGLPAQSGFNTGTNTQTLGTAYGTIFISSVPYAMSLGHATFDVTVGQASAIFYVCLYNPTGTVLLSSGNGSAASSAVVSVAMSGSVTIQPGVEYLLAWGSYGSASAPTFLIWADAAATLNILNKNGSRHFTTGNGLSGGPGCPSTTSSLTNTTVDPVAIMLEP